MSDASEAFHGFAESFELHLQIRHSSKFGIGRHIVEKLGEVLVDEPVGHGCGLCFVGINVLPVLVKSAKVSGKSIELADDSQCFVARHSL